ncbi:hypothetical protein GCM10011571_32760 [Marinithermofilum abyssi]|uniref:Uncharacterized protein n=1 Tax=Marinithermofilum abyssi TaxID=1571185 RepID=A0A8J2YF69_9BACL|nr:hypothetical protein [Marinithermofilum abyssi]GGE28113.1 hypothetical protein GCM10011571_32760 [Marinithermofilum abyssi]
MDNPSMVQIAEVQNAMNIVFTFAAAFLAGIFIIRIVKAYKDEDEHRMWKSILWGIPTVVVVWRVMDVVDFFLWIWDKVQA